MQTSNCRCRVKCRKVLTQSTRHKGVRGFPCEAGKDSAKFRVRFEAESVPSQQGPLDSITTRPENAMPRRPARPTNLPVPALEKRTLLSGNVTAKFIDSSGGKDVTITGDNSSNSIEIVQLSTDVYTLRGTSSSTKINGKSGGTFTFKFDQFDDLVIKMNGGSDYLAIKGNSLTPSGDLDITDDLAIDMGSGADRLNIKWVEIKGNLNVKMGTGDDKFNLRDSILQGRMDADGGDGNDSQNYWHDTINGAILWKSFKNPTNSDIWY
jgi:hypothetical protein